MKIKSVKRKRELNYPTIDFVALNPNILNKSIPHSWYKNEIVAGALATFVLFGCHNRKEIIKPKYQTEQIDKKNNSPNRTQEANHSVKVAPVFVHGVGSGDIACLAISSPAFLTEEEARKIISDEYKNVGLDFEINGIIKDVSLPLGRIYFDGYCKDLDFYFEFISKDDSYRILGIKPSFVSSEDFDTKRAAEVLQYEINKQNLCNTVAFYDPLVYYNYNGSGMSEEKAKEESRELLIKQVEDFIEWAEKEGLIK